MLAEFGDGHFRTKEFDSKQTPIEAELDGSDFAIADEEGNVLMLLENGHIRTKEFDSSKSSQESSKRKYQRVTRFNVDVDGTTTIPNDWATATSINAITDGKTYTDNAVLYLPTTYNNVGVPTKLIVFCKHGGSQVTDISDPVFNLNIFNYMLYLGYAILAVDGMPDALTAELNLDDTRVVGNYVAVQSVRKAYDYIVENYNVEQHQAYIFGYSQGGHYAQNVIDLSGINFVAAAELSPVCSMRYHQWDLATSGASGGISSNTRRARMNVARLFGFPTFSTMAELNALEYDQSKVQGYDPWTRNVENPYDGFIQGTSVGSNLWGLPSGTSLSGIAMKKFLKCPLKIWCANDDNVLGVDVMKVFVQAAKNAGCVADMHLMTSGGHNILASQSSIGTFVENGATCNLYPLAKEIAVWFNKFGGYKL